jgi:serine protease inhibitor
MVVCRTCWGRQKGTCICLFCAHYCHFGHKLEAIKLINGFCDCGAESRCRNRNPFAGGSLDAKLVRQLKQAQQEVASASSMAVATSAVTDLVADTFSLFSLGKKEEKDRGRWIRDMVVSTNALGDALCAHLTTATATAAPTTTTTALHSAASVSPAAGTFAISAFDIWCALNLAYLGASADAKRALELTGIWSLPDATLAQAEAAKSCVTQLAGTSTQLQSQQWFLWRVPPKPAYVELVEKKKLATFVPLDNKSSAAAVAQVNSLVAHATRQLIPSLLSPTDIDTLTTHVLLSVLYFKGRWKTRFSKTATEQGDFSGATGTRREWLMRQTGQKHPYVQTSTHQWIELDYEDGQLTMGLGLPLNEEDKTPALVEPPPSSDFVPTTIRTLVVPRFQVRSKFELSRLMSAPSFGLATLFRLANSDAAHLIKFSGFTDLDVCIARIVHESVVIVDEDGTEAAAATAVIMRTKSLSRPKGVDLIADRPFCFYIRHREQGWTLFRGRLL